MDARSEPIRRRRRSPGWHVETGGGQPDVRAVVTIGRFARRHWLITLLVAGGVALRILAVVAYRPAILYVDSVWTYLNHLPGSTLSTNRRARPSPARFDAAVRDVTEPRSARLQHAHAAAAAGRRQPLHGRTRAARARRGDGNPDLRRARPSRSLAVASVRMSNPQHGILSRSRCLRYSRRSSPRSRWCRSP